MSTSDPQLHDEIELTPEEINYAPHIHKAVEDNIPHIEGQNYGAIGAYRLQIGFNDNQCAVRTNSPAHGGRYTSYNVIIDSYDDAKLEMIEWMEIDEDPVRLGRMRQRPVDLAHPEAEMLVEIINNIGEITRLTYSQNKTMEQRHYLHTLVALTNFQFMEYIGSIIRKEPDK